MPRHRDQSCSRFKEVVKLSIGKLEQQFPIIKGGGEGERGEKEMKCPWCTCVCYRPLNRSSNI